MRDRLGRLSRRGRDLQNFKVTAAKENAIGERAAGIERDAHEDADCIASLEFSVESWELGVG